jgi:hypothetical protein
VCRGTIGPAVLLERLGDLPTDCENGIGPIYSMGLLLL